MAAQAARSATLPNFLIPIVNTGWGGYVVPSKIPNIRHTSDGSVVGNTAAVGDLTVFLYHSYVPGSESPELRVREPTPVDFPSNVSGQAETADGCLYATYPGQRYRVYLCLSVASVPRHWLLARESENDWFARRHDPRDPREPVNIQLLQSVLNNQILTWHAGPLCRKRLANSAAERGWRRSRTSSGAYDKSSRA